MENTLVFIDAEYLRLVARLLFGGKPPKYDIKKIAIELAKEQGYWCKTVFYYTAPPYQSKQSTPEEDLRKARYDSFIRSLRKRKEIVVREGRCQKMGSEYHQKGVDTYLVIDLITKPPKENVKTVIIVTSDTDFVPAIDYLKSEFGISAIIYYHVERKDSRFSLSDHIRTVCDKSIMLTRRHFEGCLLN